LNDAKKQVNQNNNLYRLHVEIKKCIENNIFPYLEIVFVGKKKNTILERTLLNRWNYLTTGFVRKPRVNSNHLYNDTNKERKAKLYKNDLKHNKINVLKDKN